MPPTSNARKSATQTITFGDPHASNGLNATISNGLQPRRTTASGRTIRANTTRPANYYARPFGPTGIGADHESDMADASNSQAPGFYPAVQYFTDAITALPKEVMKQFTLVKEVEAKVYSGNENLGLLIDGLLEHPVPPRRQVGSSATSTAAAQGLLSLTANNSISGSTNVSMVNGTAGRNSVQPSVAGSANGEDLIDTDDERARRLRYSELRIQAHSLLANLDEKNVVLSEANRVLSQQELRLDSVWPYLENELLEESRLGSMTHWAYFDNRQKTKTAASGTQNRRDVAATNNLAAAATMLHESDIAQARKDAGREAAREKAKGKRMDPTGDSDFDERLKKGSKGLKAKATVTAATIGLGIANGEPASKKKKVDKGLSAPGMERQLSAQGKGSKAARETPRSTPAADINGKKTAKHKPAPLPSKKKVPVSAQNSSLLASSPLAPTFASTNMEPPSNSRPQSARLRQNSVVTNLRHEKVLQDEESDSRPTSATSRVNGNLEKTNSRRKVQETTEEPEAPEKDEFVKRQLDEASERLITADTDKTNTGAEQRPPNSRSDSLSHKDSGRQSKIGTPRTDAFPAEQSSTVHARSTRSKPNARDDSSSSEAPMQNKIVSRHKRNMSNSHLVKQLAPFNKSPDLDRHRNRDDMDEDLDSLDDRGFDEKGNGPDKHTEQPEHQEPLDNKEHPQHQEHEETPGYQEGPEHQELEESQEHQEHKEPPQDVERETRRASTRRPVSRRSAVNAMQSSPALDSRESSTPASPLPASSRGRGALSAVSRESVAAAAEMDTNRADEEDDESEHDPDDPDEPKYCYCNRGSYGEMVACDNENCPREWFHLGCTELREAPSVEEKWYCSQCRPLFASKAARKAKTGRNGR